MTKGLGVLSGLISHQANSTTIYALGVAIPCKRAAGEKDGGDARSKSEVDVY
jgi:hypothetical protein